ncbi:MAG TPA: peptide chain release factor N(5)-glutamine methyltransferase [Stellaceae bacterium]|nr:peptide chain release factor N(5)-glutamine methyltransferase [Stellaceae bacterium]
MTGGIAIGTQATIGAAVAAAQARLKDAGVESPRRDARRLVALAAGLDDAAVLGYPERPLAAAAARRLALFVARRARGEPLSRIAGKREFWSLAFALSPATLDPRPDSETVVAAALARLSDRQAVLRILDLGTGTGCLLLALLSELPRAVGFGVDILPDAAAVARRNAKAMGLEARAFFAVGRWASGFSGTVDVVVANPPYIATAIIDTLAPEVVHYDPVQALDGGCDGLQAYRTLAPQIAGLLTPRGFACLELGAGQAGAVAEIFAAAALDAVGLHRDLHGVERCIIVASRQLGQEPPTAKKLLE